MNQSAQKKTWIAIFATAAVGFIIAIDLFGCRSNHLISNSPQMRIGVVTKSSGSEYWLSVESGIRDAANENNVSVTILSPDLETNTAMQNRLIEDCLKEDFDLLLISPLQSADASYLALAKEKKIPIVAFDTRIEQGDVPYIGIDNYRAGQKLAEEMVSQLHGTGSVGIITGDLAQESNRSRLDGMLQAFTGSGVQVAFVQSGYSNLQLSQQAVDDLMADHPNLDGILATSAVTALGLRDSLANTPIILMTFDAQADALEALENGDLGALAAQSGYLIGKEAVEAVYQAKQSGQPIAEMEDVILESPILTRDTVFQWRRDHLEQGGS